ncbi:RidA family protein [Leminorella grimontii]|uniref:RidA family protein n=1 Tax=Leminorella grimontii TaxID=82981 RepID=UPI00208D3BA2|nr:RidA family protein [Leminorella grimontii]GKX59734.1 enamine deaminase RidA [Leminorella grimontii]
MKIEDERGGAVSCINSPELSTPGGHYSHACVHGNTVYLSGQLPVDPDGNVLADRPFAEQASQVLFNIDATLRAAGSGRDRLIQVRIFITDMAQWPEFNRIYAEWIGAHRPARIVAGVSELHFGSALEVEAVAGI